MFGVIPFTQHQNKLPICRFSDIAGSLYTEVIPATTSGETITPLPTTWINSVDEAITKADANGGAAFISKWPANQTVRSAILEIGGYSMNTTAAVWLSLTIGMAGKQYYYVILDAVSGDVYVNGTTPVAEQHLRFPH